MKVIGIGNRIMTDDGIGVLVAEGLKDYMEEYDIEIMIGETDVETCLNQIRDEDFLVIIDATLFDLAPGTITNRELSSIKSNYKSYSQHDISLIDLLYRYGKKNKGYFIGIEAGEIGFGIDLSIELQSKFCSILEEVKNLIKDILEEG
ncbi:MAG: hypothetical protein CVU84_01645 [Firmicutes bacterium HGW-Firmicutes-1]|jgi:hydrogenase maturation protease|nr:MAG: hypothetical protein CVU84_01645 [Firmicutes bacterium HGW-Firmicutes-1]